MSEKQETGIMFMFMAVLAYQWISAPDIIAVTASLMLFLAGLAAWRSQYNK